MGLKLEVGKKYTDRTGNVRGPLRAIRNPAWHKFTDGNLSWGEYGAALSTRDEFDNDLIALWQDAPTGPVRTVTSKEIVPGIYNRLGVGEQSGDCIWVGLVENDGDYDLGSLLNASQLRALAATATEIADALEGV